VKAVSLGPGRGRAPSRRSAAKLGPGGTTHANTVESTAISSNRSDARPARPRGGGLDRGDWSCRRHYQRPSSREARAQKPRSPHCERHRLQGANPGSRHVRRRADVRAPPRDERARRVHDNVPDGRRPMLGVHGLGEPTGARDDRTQEPREARVRTRRRSVPLWRSSRGRSNTRSGLNGGGGIRTRGPLARTLVFKTSAFDHSATPPGVAGPDASPPGPPTGGLSTSTLPRALSRRGGRVAEGTRLLSEYGVHAPSRVRIPPSPLSGS
jgi:hypothetical protein